MTWGTWAEFTPWKDEVKHYNAWLKPNNQSSSSLKRLVNLSSVYTLQEFNSLFSVLSIVYLSSDCETDTVLPKWQNQLQDSKNNPA